MTSSPAHAPAPRAGLKRWLPLVLLGALMALAYGLGLQRYLTLQSMAEHQALLQDYVTRNLVLALLAFALIYIVVVALSLPGAAVLSILGGFVFGWALSAPVTVVAATIGAVAVFKIVQTSLGAAVAERAGPFVQRLSRGFEEDAFNYLLFLRLVPAFPFFAVNAVAGLTRMDVRSFALATLIGIIPGSIAFAWLGRGLGSVIEAQRSLHEACVAAKGAAACPFEISASSLITPQLLWAFAILGLVALIPVALKKWKSFS
ncbi:MAG: TVP38/TMEM64 family protein [Alphaproteobacteria bacterium]|nr:TVP38/TMEM64 family protein [Alphaproteobacteria bacterium]